MLAFSISIKALDILDVFGLAGLEFSQKLKICMLDLMVPITHFGQKCKGHPPKCVSRDSGHQSTTRGKQQKTEFGALLALLNQGHLFTCSPLIRSLSANPIFTAYMFFTTAPNTLLIGKIGFFHGGFFITPTMH